MLNSGSPAFIGRLFYVVLFSVTSFSAPAQWDRLKGRWTEGGTEYYLDSVSGTKALFYGFSVHEGGFAFAVRLDTDGSFFVASPKDFIPKDGSDIGHPGDRVIPKLIDGKRLLVVQTVGGIVEEVLLDMEQDSLSALEDREKEIYELSGKYLDPRTNKEVIFYPGKLMVTGLTATPHFQFAKPYDYPDPVLIFTNKVAYCYQRQDSLLVLYKAIDNGDEEYEQGAKLTTLKWIGPVDSSGNLIYDGDYKFASEHILTTGILHYFNARQRRLMRNEIFAAHGYIFKSSDLQAWFSSKPWYKGEYTSVEDQLTDLEKLNIRLLQDYQPPKER